MPRPLQRCRLVMTGTSPFALILLSAGLARAQADLTELHGYVEPCTIANYQEMFTECESCSVAGPSADGCSLKFGRRGYQKKCRTRGDGHAWEEVWCISKGAAESAAKVPTTSEERAASSAPSLVLAAGLFCAFLWMWRAWSHERPPR